MNTMQTVIAKRAKWHLYLGLFGCIVFVYPCAVGASYDPSPMWYWLSKAILLFFALPAMAYCIYQLKHQNDAIILRADEIHFATMMPWGRSVVKLREIKECSFESIPDERALLILSVCEECYQREYLSRTWVASPEGQLRFDMMYTAPALQKIASTIRNLVDASAQLDTHIARS